MQFSDTTNKNGIIQQIEFRTNLGDTGISGDATLLKQFTGQINDAYMKAVGIIIAADGIFCCCSFRFVQLPVRRPSQRPRPDLVHISCPFTFIPLTIF